MNDSFDEFSTSKLTMSTNDGHKMNLWFRYLCRGNQTLKQCMVGKGRFCCGSHYLSVTDLIITQHVILYTNMNLLITDAVTCISPGSEPFWSDADCTVLLHGGQICAMCGNTLLTVTFSWLPAGINTDCGDDDTTLPWLRARSLELVFLLDAGRSLATSLACIPVTLRNSWSSASYWIWTHGMV